MENVATSPYLNRPLRSEAEARSSRPDPFLEADIYLVLIAPKRGEYYAPESEWPVLSSRIAAMKATLTENNAFRVLYLPAEGKRQDISEDIARQALHCLRCDRRVFKKDLSDVPEFIARHLTNEEICALSFVAEFA